MAALVGDVRFWNVEKGFGFIRRDDGQPDVFVHASALKDAGLEELFEADRVAFDVEPGREGKGPKATNLALVE
jgi:CspA family cold shock protein